MPQDVPNPGPDAPLTARPRLKKRPHDLHRCADADELIAALRAMDIDLVSVVYEFVKPSADIGILAAGSIAWRVATAYSDLDLMVLLPSAEALKTKRTREIAGNAVTYLPSDAANTAEVALFMSGVEVDLYFVNNPSVDRAAGAVPPGVVPARGPHDFASDKVLTRLAAGWIVHGAAVVERWRAYYATDRLPAKWIAAEFSTAAKDLEDMAAGIGLARGHVSAIGAYTATRLMRALLALNGCYHPSLKWMLAVDRLIATADPETRDALIAGRELAFPPLFETAREEQAYFERMYAYCRRVQAILSREEAVAAITDKYIHDLDVILERT